MCAASLTVAQRRNGIDAGCPARRQHGGNERGSNDQDRGEADGRWVVWTDAVEGGPEDPRRDRKGGGNAENDAKNRESNAFAQEHTEDVRRLCTERDAQTDLIRSARGHVAHDPVQAQACEQCRETGPEPGEAGQQAVLREDIVELLINRVDADDREGRIDPAKCFTNRL